MHKFWQIVKYEYRRHVFRKRFIFALLSLPIFALFMVGLILIMSLFMSNRSPVGYVDRSGLLSDPVLSGRPDNVFEPNLEMLPFENKSQAQSALNNKEIQAFFVLNDDYLSTYQVPLVFNEAPDDNTLNQTRLFIKQNILANIDIPHMDRLQSGTNFIPFSADGANLLQDTQWYNIVLPMLIAVLFIVVIMTSGGYLLQAVVEEKENRTMEVVVTSVSPIQLMAGKIVGNISVGFTQLLVWLFFAWLIIWFASTQFPFLSDLEVNVTILFKNLAIFIPAFVSVAGLMAALGATVTESREAQQISGLFTLPIMLPIWFIQLIMENPNGVIPKVLSYFPLTAPITIGIRMSISSLPDWEWLAYLLIQIVFAALMIWLAARAFRMGMLQYGKRLSLKQLFRKEVNHV